ncbi:EBP [Branchiostoma lanceolatum]|uniref:EBP protein n=1 Tax=Branchiostoma lanceolatum TaxID=7740 RepID=A0A8J9ZZP2_BRALA|nr:EBP [Branchiostoma lanceolatum]
MVENVSTHPYLPPGLKLPCGYVENDKSILEILGVFFGLTAVVMVSTWIYSGSNAKVKLSTVYSASVVMVSTWIYSGSNAKVKLSTVQRLTVCWFVLCGCIHLILEGWFSVFHNSIAGDQSFLSQLWKEYSKADSRYVSADAFALRGETAADKKKEVKADTFTVVMETVTAWLEGPGCLLIAMGYVNNNPNRYVLQLLVSTGQLYGTVLYIGNEVKDGFVHGLLWDPLYFWFYFVVINSPWVIFPTLLMVQSCGRMIQAQAQMDKAAKGKKKKN